RRSPPDGRGLHPRSELRDAAHRRRRNWDRPPHHDPDRFAIHSRRHPVPAAASRGLHRNRSKAARDGRRVSVRSRFELFIARRYLRARRKEAVISVITAISIIGVAAGVMALIVALAINTGFRNTLERNLLGATAHVNV